jgi:hypothetical protein
MLEFHVYGRGSIRAIPKKEKCRKPPPLLNNLIGGQPMAIGQYNRAYLEERARSSGG